MFPKRLFLFAIIYIKNFIKCSVFIFINLSWNTRNYGIANFFKLKHFLIVRKSEDFYLLPINHIIVSSILSVKADDMTCKVTLSR